MAFGLSAAAIGGIAAATGAVGGAIISSQAAKGAAKTQAASTGAAIDEQQRQYDLTRQDFAPWRAAGERALGSLEQDINRMPTSAEVMSDPGYKFGMDQGQQALDRKIASMGGRVSGAALKQASRYNQGYAGAAYGAAYQRRQDRLNRLAALAGVGQTATGASAAAGQQSTNAITGLIAGQGDATAGSQMYQGSVWGNTSNQVGALLQRGFNSQQQSQYPWNVGGGWTGDH